MVEEFHEMLAWPERLRSIHLGHFGRMFEDVDGILVACLKKDEQVLD